MTIVTDKTWLCTWTMRDGTKIRLGKMGLDHIVNTIAMRKRALDTIEAGYPIAYPSDIGDGALMAIECEERAMEHRMEELRTWIDLLVAELNRRVLKRRKIVLSHPTFSCV